MKKYDPAPDSRNTEYDHSLADSYIGKHLLFGITICDKEDRVLEQNQFHGEIIEINEHVIKVRLYNSDEIFTLPPFIEELESAPPGEYKLRSTGEVVVNPDLISSYKIIQP